MSNFYDMMNDLHIGDVIWAGDWLTRIPPMVVEGWDSNEIVVNEDGSLARWPREDMARILAHPMTTVVRGNERIWPLKNEFQADEQTLGVKE